MVFRRLLKIGDAQLHKIEQKDIRISSPLSTCILLSITCKCKIPVTSGQVTNQVKKEHSHEHIYLFSRRVKSFAPISFKSSGGGLVTDVFITVLLMSLSEGRPEVSLPMRKHSIILDTADIRSIFPILCYTRILISYYQNANYYLSVLSVGTYSGSWSNNGIPRSKIMSRFCS